MGSRLPDMSTGMRDNSDQADAATTAGDSARASLPRLSSLDRLAALVEQRPKLYVRYSKGPEHDRTMTSRDHESGLTLPGLSVSPLEPAEWWTRPTVEWLARQLCRYAHLRDRAPDERVAWVLAGDVVGRGPDNEPLVCPWEAVAVVDDALVDRARQLYEERFDVGRDSTN
jgi:hypothetical protein